MSDGAVETIREALDRARLDLSHPARRALHALESQNQALQEALRLGLLAMERHDAWCGHNRHAPGDSIHHQFTDAARNALSPTQETDPDSIGEPGVDWVDADHPCKRCGQIMPHTHDLRPTQETDSE